MEKDLSVQVKQLVDDLFNEKEEADIRKRTEEELEKAATTISELTTSLEAKNEEFSAVEKTVVEKDEQIEALKSELEAAKKEAEIANTKVSEVASNLEEIKKDMASEKRMVDLEDAGVARSDRKTQVAKVREMSDEEFASYKEELISIRDVVIKELEKTKSNDNEQANTQEEVAKKEEEITPPAQIDKEKVELASLNLESDKAMDVNSKYKELGLKMAERWVKK